MKDARAIAEEQLQGVVSLSHGTAVDFGVKMYTYRDTEVKELVAALRDAPGVASHDESGTPIIWEGVCTDPFCGCAQSKKVFATRAILAKYPQP